jgi:hypothetical protein
MPENEVHQIGLYESINKRIYGKGKKAEKGAISF